MKITLTPRDKVLLKILCVLIAVALPYFLLVRPMINKHSALIARTQELTEKRNSLQNLALAGDTYQDKTNEYTAQKNDILARFPDNLAQEENILFIYETEKEIPISLYQTDFQLVPGTQVETADTEQALEESAPVQQESTLIAARTQFSFEAGYEEFKELLCNIAADQRRMVITDITAVYASELDTVSGNFTLMQYALSGKGTCQNPYEAPNLIQGTTDIFQSASGIAAEEEEREAELFLILQKEDAGGHTYILGRNADTLASEYLTAEDNKKLEVSVDITGENGNYQAVCTIGAKENTKEFLLTSEQGIYFEILSSARGSDDQVEAVLMLNNQSDTTMYVTVINDDIEKPRVNIKGMTGDILKTEE